MSVFGPDWKFRPPPPALSLVARAHGGGDKRSMRRSKSSIFGRLLVRSLRLGQRQSCRVRMTDWRSWPRRGLDGGPLTYEQLPLSLRWGAGVRAKYNYLQELVDGIKRHGRCVEKSEEENRKKEKKENRW